MKLNRWIPAIAGTLILLFAGLVYAWSILSVPIAAEFTHWTQAQLSLTFTLVMIFFCLGGLAGGLLAGKLKPQLSVAGGGLLFLAGFLLASRIQTPAGLYLTFGILCGFASGIVYNAVMSTVGRWFPDRPGLISGILLMGFGFSAFLIGKAYQAWTPDRIGGWRTSFVVMGIAVCAVLVLCAPLIRRPGPDFQAPAAVKKQTGADLTTGQMLRSGDFWLYYVWTILLVGAGLVLVSQGSGIASRVGTNVSPSAIATTVGMISVFNGVGRVIIGQLFDRVGRRRTMELDNLLFVLSGLLLVLATVLGSYALVVVGFILGGMAYGGVPTISSAFVSARYGRKHYPVNFPLINTNLIISSVGSTVAGALYDATGSFLSCCWLIIGLAAVSFLFAAGITLLERKQ